jgi:hypothetical protein
MNIKVFRCTFHLSGYCIIAKPLSLKINYSSIRIIAERKEKGENDRGTKEPILGAADFLFLTSLNFVTLSNTLESI